MEVGLWRLADGAPARVAVAKLPAEDELEELVMRDPSVLGEPLLIIGRQVHTAHGGRIDLLGLDEAARVHALELKRDQTPRDVVAQTLDHTSCASALGHADLTEVYSHFSVKPGRDCNSTPAWRRSAELRACSHRRGRGARVCWRSDARLRPASGSQKPMPAATR